MSKKVTATKKPAEDQGKQRMDILQKYVSDMLALEEQISSAVKQQLTDESLAKHSPKVRQIIQDIAETSERQELAMKSHLESIGGDPAAGIKEVATAVVGTLAGLYNKVRTESVSKMLRDDYTAASLAAMGYTMLYTTALSLNDLTTATLSLTHLEKYAKIIMVVHETIPELVITDLRDNGTLIDERVLPLAIANTQSVWQPEGAPENGKDGSAKSTGSKPRASSQKATAGEGGEKRSASSKPSKSESGTVSKSTTTSSKSTASKAKAKDAVPSA